MRTLICSSSTIRKIILAHGNHLSRHSIVIWISSAIVQSCGSQFIFFVVSSAIRKIIWFTGLIHLGI